MPGFRTRTAITTAAASFATLTLIPWAVEASRTQRVLLLAGAVPIAVLFGAIAGWAPPAPPASASSVVTAGTSAASAASAASAVAVASARPAPSTGAPVAGLGPARSAPPAPAPDPLGQPVQAHRMVSWAQLPPQVRAALAAGRAGAAPQHAPSLYS